MALQTRRILSVPGCWIVQISADQRGAVMGDEVAIGVHGVFPLPMGMGWMVTWPPGIPVSYPRAAYAYNSGNCPTPCSFTPPTAPSVSPVKSHPRLLQERIAPPPLPGSNQRVAPTKRRGNWSLTASPRPRVHTSIENRPVHNVGSDGLSPHLNVVADRKQSHLFVYVILRWVWPLTRTVPLDSPGSVNPCHPARG
ncbi:hypothetical protein THAOC_06356 [Thalassiosira oceanica]|uniref:Uncharacterized protein n=1 Tax=Thalassiosira oceanica TaxID=159749 RepID=K0TLU2_THAOC|nr:hypothetical protein THAOC_06356 [Thalassiosira oceanica]|eukprot:EJK72142.1 hypothetical protein THAOC_06356 [Thalassiosira oceanica]